jgi:hypothetical protein
MPITERGRWSSSLLDERGRRVFGSLDERGGMVVGLSVAVSALKGRTGMTSLVDAYGDDEITRFIGTKFDFPFYGVPYNLEAKWTTSDSLIGSNSWVSFGMAPQVLYVYPADIRGISISPDDRHFDWVGYEATDDYYRLRWEGGRNYDNNSPSYEWELTLFRDGVIQLAYDPKTLTLNDINGGSGRGGFLSNGTDVNYVPYNLTAGNINVIRFTPKANPAQGYDVLYDAPQYVLASTPTIPPLGTVVTVSRAKISDETGADRALVTFTFDQDITQWEVRVLGAGNGTGTLADSGGVVTQGTQITAEIDFTELYQEGTNKVNIYGKNSAGLWTPYE